jgi:hypothetical protein
VEGGIVLKMQVVILLCVALADVSATTAITPTITIYTEPPELEIWADGEYVGVGEAVLFGPFENYVEVTVKGEGYKDTVKEIRSPGADGRNLVIVAAVEKKKGFSWDSLGIGFATGLGMFCLIFAGDL